MSNVRDIAGDKPTYFDLIYLVHPSDFLPADQTPRVKGTSTVAEDPNAARARSFRMNVVWALDRGNLQSASAGVNRHALEYFALNTSELYDLQHHKDLLLAEASAMAAHLHEDRCHIAFFTHTLSRPNVDTCDAHVLPRMAKTAKLVLAADQASFDSISSNIGHLSAIIREQAERACHHELYLPRAHTPPVAHSATWYVTRFIFRSTVVLATHDNETTTSECLDSDEEADEEDGEAGREAGDQDPAPPTYDAASQDASYFYDCQGSSPKNSIHKILNQSTTPAVTILPAPHTERSRTYDNNQV
ncbi:uncharacterized protein MELLADRAFT_61788 [Melampsora larici-populina 98AG31]|uniref:Uncharacterized protein n=1 Tax=Melampsora larici-populina (strain 98AG31 / pathotype 3-4-7) TaxID=747676 RepID=F4RGG7_MELLP|nr:uncharacterized protein MELLADRAFT_61788 [Melampsora larici-populina 98AG31]EGG08653.1 hypothetical protein MELLADRAFT_61788 [Melampsora larici-populina 98AG31]